MPPTRTIPPAKAVKTERTHEENQERYADLLVRPTLADHPTEHILQLLGEVTEALKHE